MWKGGKFLVQSFYYGDGSKAFRIFPHDAYLEFFGANKSVVFVWKTT